MWQRSLVSLSRLSQTRANMHLPEVFFHMHLWGATLQEFLDQIFNIQQKLIKDIAQKEPCVIVGRCADYILSDRDDVLNVFIEANTPEKAARIKKLYQKSDDEVKKLLKDVDKKRSVNYRYFTDKEWGNRKNYDLVLNSSVLGYDKCIELIASAYA